MPRFALLLSLSALASPAHAVECWKVTGWTASTARGWPVPAGAIERAMVTTARCDVTPPGLRWMEVTQSYGAPPTDLYVLVSHEDATRSDGETLDRGLVYQGAVFGVVPLLWRDISASDSPLELLAPTPAAPAAGAYVVLRQQDSDDCLYGGPVSYSPHIYIGYYGLGCSSVNPAALWSDATFEIVSAGNNALGDPLYRFEQLNYDTCSYAASWYGDMMILQEDCALGWSDFAFQIRASSSGYVLESEDTGLCYGGHGSLSPDWLRAISCADPGAVYDIVTLQAAPSGPPSGPPGEIPPPSEEQ